MPALIRCNTMCAASITSGFLPMSRPYNADASLCSYEDRSRIVTNAQTAAATSNRSDATAIAWIAEPVRGMSGCLGSAGLPGSSGLVWLDWLFWLGDGFDAHCYLRADFIMAGGTELQVRSPIGGFSIACCSDGDGLDYRIKCLSLGDCCSASSICLFRACSCSASATRR